MADFQKYQRSKEKLLEILNIMTAGPACDKTLNSFITNLKKAISVIDNKIKQVAD